MKDLILVKRKIKKETKWKIYLTNYTHKNKQQFCCCCCRCFKIKSLGRLKSKPNACVC